MNLPARALRLFALSVCLAVGLRAAEAPPTVITSDQGEMVSSETDATFTFRDNVVVTGTNLKINCDLLVVVANKTGDPKATFGNQDKFKSLVATGHVKILQNDREATCERAEVFPGQDKVVLTGNPVVRSLDGNYRADGPRLVLYRGERRAVIEGGPTERVHISLPPLKDLGYGKEPVKNTPAQDNNATPPAPPK